MVSGKDSFNRRDAEAQRFLYVGFSREQHNARKTVGRHKRSVAGVTDQLANEYIWRIDHSDLQGLQAY